MKSKTPSRKITPTQYQIEIFKFIWYEKGNLLIKAVAGSGKTTTIVDAIKGIKGRSKLKIAFMAFNKHIADELKKKLPPGITISTFHGLGLASIRKANGGTKPELDEYEVRLKSLIKKKDEDNHWFTDKEREDKELVSSYKADIFKLVKLCKLCVCTSLNEVISIGRKYNFVEFRERDYIRVFGILEEYTNGRSWVLSP